MTTQRPLHLAPAHAAHDAAAGARTIAVSRHTAEACLAVVRRSPQAVAAHDRAAWLALFARYNIVEDPVGATPHVSGLYDRRSGLRGHGPLARFHDCFIAPLKIVFHVEHDFVSVSALSVVRDLAIELHMTPQVSLRVPMHLRYQLIDEDGVLKLQHLSAHWELWPMLRQLMSHGLASLRPGLSLGRRMLSQLGLAGTLGFMRALDNVGQPGKERLAALVQACNRRAADDIRQHLSSDFAGIAWSSAATLSGIERLLELPGLITLGKTLAAGNYISASFTLQPSSVSAQAHRPAPVQGVVFCEFNRREQKIQRLSVYMGASVV